MVNVDNYKKIIHELGDKITIVAVSKTKPVEDIQALYNLGQRDFGENYVQELEEKYSRLPKDIRWHFIGHLQSNKVKQVAAFVQLIHGVDSLKLLKEINKQAEKNGTRSLRRRGPGSKHSPCRPASTARASRRFSPGPYGGRGWRLPTHRPVC